MSDPLAMEKVDQLEARLSAALARIDAAIGQMGRGQARIAPATAPHDASEIENLRAELALEQRTRLDLAARLKAMEAQAQGNSDGAELRASEAEKAHAALRVEFDTLRAAHEALQAEMANAAPPPAQPAPVPSAEAESEVQILRMRAARLRDERNQARDERDAAREALEDQGKTVAPDDIIALRVTIARLQEALEEIRSTPEPQFDRELLQSGLLAEIRALKAQRNADAQDLAQILADIDAITEEGGA
ncbi:hypothetical protein OE810_03605 [Rhodobacteraceae bacterium XHP0102]|nr:hypothetical protein [Rhodobacteraceae bacterium XHP0102]